MAFEKVVNDNSGTLQIWDEAAGEWKDFDALIVEYGGGSGDPSYPDDTFNIYDDADNTKKINFQAGNITTSTTRTITMPDKDVTLDDSTDTRPPSSHASSHTDGTDDIQDATNSQKGLATAAHITTLENLSSSLGALTPDDSTEFGLVYHVKVPCVGGGAGLGNVNWGRVTVPSGTWRLINCWFVMRGNGTTGDSLACYVSSPHSTYVTSLIDVSSEVDDAVVFPDKLNNDYDIVGNGSTLIMAVTDDSNAGDAPPFDMHVLLRKTADA